jgi:predicted nucleic acid-binding protein
VKVVDASLLIFAVGDEGAAGGAARRALRGRRLTAPSVVDLEVVTGVRRLLAQGRIDERRARSALQSFMAIPIRRQPHSPMLARVWALRDNVSPYDAAYVALAEALDVPLITADRRLAQAPGATCAFELVSPSTQG